MHSLKRSINVPAALLLAVLCSVLAYQVFAQGQSGGGNCHCVVSVDLPAVLEGLNERAEAELKLKAMKEERITEDAKKQEDLKKKQSDLDALPEGDARRDKLSEDLMLAALEYQNWRAFTAEQLDIEKSLMFRDLDHSVMKAIDELADANGYDIVIMNDSSQQLGVNPEANVPREVQVTQQMTARRTLHVNPDADITQELVQRMNNAHNAGG